MPKINSGDLISIAKSYATSIAPRTSRNSPIPSASFYEAALTGWRAKSLAVNRMSETEAVRLVEANLTRVRSAARLSRRRRHGRSRLSAPCVNQPDRPGLPMAGLFCCVYSRSLSAGLRKKAGAGGAAKPRYNRWGVSRRPHNQESLSPRNFSRPRTFNTPRQGGLRLCCRAILAP